MTLVLIVLAAYALLVTVLCLLFPRSTLTVGHIPPRVRSFDTARYFDCGCRIEGSVGVPGCDDCTEPGLRS